MPKPTFYYGVKVQVGDKTETATFCESANREFDLLYGWVEYTSASYPTLEDALANLHKHLRTKHPDKIITLGKPRLITKQQAQKKSHRDKPSAC